MPSLKRIFVDENQRETNRHYPIFIILASLVEIALLIYTIVDSKGLSSMSENPMAGPSNYTLLRSGAKFVPCMKTTFNASLQQIISCPSVVSLSSNNSCTYEQYLSYLCNVETTLKGFPHQAYRFFIPIFLHAGIIHLVMNLLSQLSFCIPLEQKFGSIRIAIIYILSGIGGVLLSTIGLPRAPGVGASGALFAIASLIVGFLIPLIDYMAHIGGFIVGILTGFFLCPNLYWTCGRKIQVTKARLIYMGISFAFLLAFFLGGFIGFYRAETPILF